MTRGIQGLGSLWTLSHPLEDSLRLVGGGKKSQSMLNYDINDSLMTLFLHLHPFCTLFLARRKQYAASLYLLLHNLIMLRSHFPSFCGSLAWKRQHIVNVTLEPPDLCPTVGVQDWYMMSNLFPWEDIWLCLPLYYMAWIFMLLHYSGLKNREYNASPQVFCSHWACMVLKSLSGMGVACLLHTVALSQWEEHRPYAHLILLYARLSLYLTLIVCIIYDACYIVGNRPAYSLLPPRLGGAPAPTSAQESVGLASIRSDSPEPSVNRPSAETDKGSLLPEDKKNQENRDSAFESVRQAASLGATSPMSPLSPDPEPHPHVLRDRSASKGEKGTESTLASLASAYEPPLPHLAPSVSERIWRFHATRGVTLGLGLILHCVVFLGEYRGDSSNVAFLVWHHAKHLVTTLLVMSVGLCCMYRFVSK